VLISGQVDKIGSRHGSESDANDSSAELTGSCWGCYLHSSSWKRGSVQGLVLAQDTCSVLGELAGKLPKYTARVLGENEPLHGTSFPGTCTVLLPSSILRETVPGLYTSLPGHCHLWALPGRNRARRCGVSKTTGQALLARILLKTNTMKNL